MIINGNNIEELKKFDDNYFDSIVTDPPYEIGFMGKGWDASGIANNPEMWSECLRVLKPGGYLLSFSATRTYHRMAVAIEDSGFEIRDMIEWVYGSGFPKSLNIGKAVDKLGGVHPNWKPLEYEKAVRDSGKTHSDIDQHLGLKASSCYWSRTDHRKCTPLYKHWILIKEYLKLDDNFAKLIPEREREVVGTKTSLALPISQELDGWGEKKEFNITKGTSEWEGWGTALKPAHEPICMARKPLAEKTVAENVLKYGTGGINIDESRVGSDERFNAPATAGKDTFNCSPGSGTEYQGTTAIGRFPANLIHDNSEEVRECFPETTERFFKSIIYQAKASKSERGTANSHPTVKPIALMEYLIKMVTPTNGIVLDPFMGSGSTGVACVLNDFEFVGIDLDKDYCEIARARIEGVKETQTKMF